MRTRAIIARFSALAAAAFMMAASASAQGYYDDDIYYDARKATPKTTPAAPKQQAPTQYYYDGAAYVPWNNVGEFQSADTYQPTGSSTRDVDEYNRRTPQAVADKQHPDSISLQQFEEMSNTRNLARFHDSEVAQEAYTEDTDYAAGGYDLLRADVTGNGSGYVDYAYAEPGSTVNINLYGGYGYPYYGRYYTDPFYWNSWYYDPWWGYGPSYNWWYGPSYAWGWGPSWGPGWGPSWGWSPGWGPGWGPSWGWGGPSWGGSVHHTWTSSGAYAPNRPSAAGSTGTYRPNTGRYTGSTSTSNRGSIYNSNGTRGTSASSNGYRGTSQPSATERPGYRQPTARPSSVNGNTGGNGVSSGSTNRGRSGYYNYGSSPATNTPSRSTSTAPSYNSNTPSYNSNSSRGSSYNSSGSRGSYSGSSGASRSSGGSGGTSRGRGR